jgi:acyl carrier protein
MGTSDPRVFDAVVETLGELARDWEYGEPVTPETTLFEDLGFESLDLVVLGTSLQEKYGRLPFTEFLTEIGERNADDISVGELAEFISMHARTSVTGDPR